MTLTLRALVLLAAASLGSMTAWAQDVALAAGQVWGIKNRPTVEVTIGRVDLIGSIKVVHVSVMGIAIPGGDPEAPQLIAVSHLAFSEQAVREAVDRLIRTDGEVTPGFEDAYANWQAKRSGVLAVGVHDAIDLLVDQYRKAAARPE